MIDMNKLNSGDVFILYQKDLFNEKDYLHRGKWKYIDRYKDKDIIFEDEQNEKYIFPLWQINNGFWRFERRVEI